MALWGMGGIGKTSLVHQLLQAPEIQRAFWNGGLWAELGAEGKLEPWVRQWCHALRLPLDPSDTVTRMVARVRDYVAQPGKRFLVVIDDVWELESLNVLWPLKAVPGIGFLATTRDRQVALAVSPEAIEVPPMREGEALELLRHEIAAPSLETELVELGEEWVTLLNCIPLAVSLLGKQVKLRRWAYVSQWVRNERTRLTMLESRPQPDRYTSIRLMLDLSYQSLSPELALRFRRLGMFPYGGDFTALTLLDLWDADVSGMALSEALLIGEKSLFALFDLGLLELTYQDTLTRRFKLHTVVHDYARTAARQAGEWEACRLRYLQVYTHLTHTLMQDFDRFRWQVEGEWPNIEQALRYACEAGYYEEAAFLMGDIHSFLLLTGRLGKLNEWLTLLETHWDTLSSSAQGRIDHARVRYLYALQRWEEAVKHKERLLLNTQVEARIKGYICLEGMQAALQQGNTDTASSAYEQASRYAASSEDAALHYALLTANAQWQQQGEYEQAVNVLNRAVEMAVEMNHPAELGNLWLWMAELFFDLGNVPEIERCLNNALDIAQVQGLITLEWNASLNLAALYLELKRTEALSALEARLRELLEQMVLPLEETMARRVYLDYLFADGVHLKEN